jgi:hypothetical protein
MNMRSRDHRGYKTNSNRKTAFVGFRLLEPTIKSVDRWGKQSTVKNAILYCGGFDRGRKGGTGVGRGDESGQSQAQ